MTVRPQTSPANELDGRTFSITESCSTVNAENGAAVCAFQVLRLALKFSEVAIYNVADQRE